MLGLHHRAPIALSGVAPSGPDRAPIAPSGPDRPDRAVGPRSGRDCAVTLSFAF